MFRYTALLLAMLIALAGCDGGSLTAPRHGPVVTLPSGLRIEDLKIGAGALAVKGNRLSVQYSGWLTDGKLFDSSYTHGQPFTFQLGTGQVIAGWDQGVSGMRVGGKRRLIIPPELAYGAAGTPGGPIPPNSTLVFEVELSAVSP